MKFILNTNIGMVSRGRRFSHFPEAALAEAKKAAMDVLEVAGHENVSTENDFVSWVGNKYPSKVGFVAFIGHLDAEELAVKANDAFVDALDAFELKLAKTDIEFYERALETGQLEPSEVEWASDHVTACKSVIERFSKEKTNASGS